MGSGIIERGYELWLKEIERSREQAIRLTQERYAHMLSSGEDPDQVRIALRAELDEIERKYSMERRMASFSLY